MPPDPSQRRDAGGAAIHRGHETDLPSASSSSVAAASYERAGRDLAEMRAFCASVHAQLGWFGDAVRGPIYVARDDLFVDSSLQLLELGCDSLDFLFSSSEESVEGFFAHDIPRRYPEQAKKTFLMRESPSLFWRDKS